MSGETFVSQREFDRYREGIERELTRLRHDLDDKVAKHDRDVDRIDQERDADRHAEAEALKQALKELGEERNGSWVRRIGAIGAGAGVVAAWVALMELWHSSGR